MQFYILDVFAEELYSGNQLAVFRGNPDSVLMQKLALEMDYSETTFITSDTPHDGGYDVRIFTSVSELPFAGHPTLGTAFVIREELTAGQPAIVHLNLKVGQIPVRFSDDGFVWMRQKPPRFGHIYEPDEVAQVLNLPLDELDTRYPIQEVSTGMPYIIVPLRTRAAVERASVNLPRLMELIEQGKRHLNADALYVFAPEAVKAENQIHARCFVHLHGSPEDAATGSANGCFAGWLVHQRYFGNERVQVRVEQGYQLGRPSLIMLDTYEEDGEIVVNVGGKVFMVARGELLRS